MKLKLIALLTLFVTTTHSAAASTIFVANNGFNNGACGVKNAPCRSISYAIAKAADGDKIIVGPGRYGDLNNDGDLEDNGEEFGSDADDAMFPIYKRIKIFSSAGAAATLIDGKDFYPTVFKVLADGVIIGRNKRGFTIKGGTSAAVYIKASGVKIVSNRLHSYSGYGLSAGCIDEKDAGSAVYTRGVIINNSANFNTESGLRLCSNTASWVLRSNESSLNSASGMDVAGKSHKLLKNTILGNAESGAVISAEFSRVSRNTVNANGSLGINLAGAANFNAKFNAIIGNNSFGTFFYDSGLFTKSNIYGNNEDIGAGYFLNCGLFAETNDASYANNYWGTNVGAGQNPADQVCSNLVVERIPSYSKKEFRIKVVQPKQ